MSGIYVHIPFCKQKCHYCNFHFSTNLNLIDNLVTAICKEIELKKNKSIEVKTLYFGGGTPSLLKEKHIHQIFKALNTHFNLSALEEITIEINPEDVNPRFLNLLNTYGFNRLSIGCQSFNEDNLQLINRNHSAVQSIKSIQQAQDFGFDNISIDLIYGIPHYNPNIWQEDLLKAINFNIQHISAYALTVEPKTVISYLVITEKLRIDEVLQLKQFTEMREFLQQHQFNHYEISNFALTGFESKHNTSYWNHKPYIGIGPAAHSFDGHNKRYWNVPNNPKYIKSLISGLIPQEEEILNLENQYNELIMLGLRTNKGIDIEEIHKKFPAFYTHFSTIKNKYLDMDWVELVDNQLMINPSHLFKADGIASDFMVI